MVCVIKNSATLAGSLFTLHASQIRIDLPTLTEKDKEVSETINVIKCILSFLKTTIFCWSYFLLVALFVV